MPSIKYLNPDHHSHNRNQAVSVSAPHSNNSHSLRQLIDDLCSSLEMLDKVNRLTFQNLGQDLLPRRRPPSQVMASIKALLLLLEGVNSTVLMQSQLLGGRN